jgi:hypothetical protein
LAYYNLGIDKNSKYQEEYRIAYHCFKQALLTKPQDKDTNQKFSEIKNMFPNEENIIYVGARGAYYYNLKDQKTYLSYRPFLRKFSCKD